MANDEIVFYDIPSGGHCSCWSPNTWKSRLVLNYKQLPYRTEWLEYPDIEPKLKSYGIPPNPPGSWSDYSCPAIQLPNGEYVMDSFKIAEKLELLHPGQSLHLSSEANGKVQKAMGAAIMPLRYMIFVAVVRNILREPSKSWFAEDRARRFGKSLDQLAQEEGGEPAWEVAHRGLELLKTELIQNKRDDGPFVLGSTVSYADFIVAGFINWLEKADSKLYERFVGYDESIRKQYEACRPWLARDDR